MIKIERHVIKKWGPPFIIAEAGINHNGEIEKAYSMIKTARDAGADSIKFQTFRVEEFVGDPNELYTYKSQGKDVTESLFEMFKRCEFSRQEWSLIAERCKDEGITFLSTPQNKTDLDLLLGLGIGAIKVGSDDFTNIPLLKSYAVTGLPMIVSCGMADLAEVYQALETIGSLDGYPTILMLCTSEYPTPPEDVNLLKLKTLSDAFPMITPGFSDHTQGTLASSLAVSFGAAVFEKHFTLDHDLPGPDHWFSEDPDGLRGWINSIRTASSMMGSGVVRPTETEKKIGRLGRRSITAIAEIGKGEKLTANNIGLRRPGNGLPPRYFEEVMGLYAARSIKKGALLKWGDFS
jgi:sialic acid synthase SpsE